MLATAFPHAPAFLVLLAREITGTDGRCEALGTEHSYWDRA